MSALTCPGHDLLLLVEHELADEAEAERVRAHQRECAACQASAGFLADALAAPALPFDPAEELGSLKELLAAQPIAAPALELEGVRLLCTYCKDGLPRLEASYCAECLAPHHADCHAEHGGCAVAGCAGRAVVGSSEPAPPRERPGRLVPFLFGVVLCGGAMAALLPEDPVAVAEAPAPAAPAASAPAASSPAEEPARAEAYRVVSYPVAGLLARRGDEPEGGQPEWVEDYERILATRPVTLNFPDTPFTEVVGFLQDITGLNITLSPEVDASGKAVSVRLHAIKLRDALDIMLEQVGLARVYQNNTILIVPGDRRPSRNEPASWPLPPQDSAREARARELGEEVRAHVIASLGEAAWAKPASLDLGLERLIVSQTEAGHAAVQAYLRSRRGPDGEAFPASLLDAWFAPGPGYVSPAQERARHYAKRLQQQQVTLNFDRTPLGEAVSFLKDISGLQIRLSPEASEALVARPCEVSLRLKAVSLQNALNLIVSNHPQLVWEVDRRGVLIRPFAGPSLAAQLRACAERAEDSSDLRAIREALAKRRFTLNFKQTFLRDAIDFLRDVSGLNFVAEPGVELERPVDVALLDAPLSEALEALLKPLELGYVLRDGVIRLVPRAEAEERAALQRKLEALRQQRLSEEPLEGIDLGQLAQRIEQRTGALVVFGSVARRCRARLALPAGVSVDEGLTLAALQVDLQVRWAWLEPERKPVLALEVSGRGALIEAAARAQTASPWSGASESALQTLRQAQAKSLARLEALAKAGAQPGLRERIEGAFALDEALQDVLGGHEALGSEEALESQRRHLKTSESTYQALLRTLSEQADLRQRVELSKREHARRAKEAVAWQEGAEPGSADSRAARVALTELGRERGRVEREEKLEAARLASTLAQWEARARKVTWWTPDVLDALDRKRAALEEGASWGDAFPEGFRAWFVQVQRRAGAELQRGAQRLRQLGLGLREGELSALRAAGGLQIGDRLLTLSGDQPESLLGWVAAFGRRPAGEVELKVSREVAGAEQEVELQLELPKPKSEAN